jgi:hypothetical protein
MQAGKGATIGRLLAGPQPLRLHGDRVAAQALIGAGLAAASTVPLLFLLSLELQLAVAVPTVLAAGYFVIAQALALHAGRLAWLWSAIIFGGLIAWTLYFSGVASPSVPHAALALVGPLFAAAPSLALRAIGGTEIRPSVRRPTAMEAEEPAILLDGEGRILTANEGARALLDGRDLSPGMDAARLMPLFARPAFLEAVCACRRGGEQRMSLDMERGALEVSLQASGSGLVMRLCPNAHNRTKADYPAKAADRADILPSTAPVWRQLADVADAVSAACRAVSPRAEARRVSLVNRAVEAVAVAVEAPRLKDALESLLVAAAEQSARDGRVEIACRAQRGAIVIRAEGSRAPDSAPDMVQDAVRLADAASGSVIFSRDAESFALELRLPAPYPPRVATQGDTHEDKGCTQ